MKESTKLKIYHCFFPNKCPCCKRVIPATDLFCKECFEGFKETDKGERCKVCFSLKTKCECKKYPKFYFRSIAPFKYQAPLKNAIISFKRIKNQRLAKFFAENIVNLIAKKYKNVKFDAIIPVPLHKSRKRQRGFNQSEMLCNELSKILEVPVLNNVLHQVKRAKSQHTLNFKQRRLNVKGIYQTVSIPIEYQRVLLVDDIMTSCSTLNECAKVLRIEGVTKIYCATIAKTE